MSVRGEGCVVVRHVDNLRPEIVSARLREESRFRSDRVYLQLPGAFRLCIYLQYCTSQEKGNVFEIKRFKNDPVRFLAIAHSAASAGTDVRAPHDMAN